VYNVERSGRGLLADLFLNLPGGIDENHEIFIHDNGPLGRDLKLGPVPCVVQYLIRVDSRYFLTCKAELLRLPQQ
jgi:hypothetical protein